MSTRGALGTLKLAELRRLAVLSGLNNGGTKSALAARISQHVFEPAATWRPASNARTRILSIDMGIRNLAYCVVDVPGTAFAAETQRAKDGDDASKLLQGFLSRESTRRAFCGLELVAWNRTAVSSSPPSPPAAPRTASGPASRTRLQTPAKESFEPSVFAAHAYNLVAGVFAQFQPTAVLIERQRYRSGGAPTVLEWTVRVNMFESMLHAVFHTLRMQQLAGTAGDSDGARGGDALPAVTSVDPKKVANFWIPPGDALASAAATTTRKDQDSEEPAGSVGAARRAAKRPTRTSKVEKEAKIALADSWLRESFSSFAAHAPAPQYEHQHHYQSQHQNEPQNDKQSSAKPKPGPLPEPRARAPPFTMATAQAARQAAQFLAARDATQSGARRRRVASKARARARGSSVNGDADADEPVDIDGAAQDTPAARAGAGAGAGAGKLDDLADCLLQAAAAAQWEANRREMRAIFCPAPAV